jgi:hypothetical protein
MARSSFALITVELTRLRVKTLTYPLPRVDNTLGEVKGTILRSS